FAIYSGHGSRSEDEAKGKETAQKILKLKLSISEMAAKYHAVTDWDKEFKSREFYVAPVYTLEVQNALLETDGRPILFHAPLADIEKAGNRYIVRFGGLSYPDIYFELECSPGQVRELLENQDDLSRRNYAVVAQIKRVFRPNLVVRAYPRKGEETGIEIESSDIYMAEGTCVDLLYMGVLFWEFME
ncbi:MAG: hypothetical protein ACE5JO_11095, partial [Candidatus Binatia bacterium]